ncbi:B12-binding domain-containing radical SAM protein [Kitasatospora sp. NPDC057541]|uniref:B12-binding domain-containing radical SAM protein n=1 Tax=unclassified Kitasatospora TaxID=2633591 RepID=UPI00369E9063
MLDTLLVFPPQWSAFQPSLSLPSLSAWLRRAGYGVHSLDLNVLFYDWLLSERCADLLAREVAGLDQPSDIKDAYLAVFASSADFRADLARLRGADAGADGEGGDEYFDRHYLAVRSLGTYLYAVSQVCEQFAVGPYSFQLAEGNLSSAALERMVESPPPLLLEFAREMVEEHILTRPARSIGLSCIGQEQLYFTLLLGSVLKQRTDVPILVGGTIFSRIFERGVLKPEWFERFFDVVVRNEGERPAEHILRNLRDGLPLTEGVPGVVYRSSDGRVVSAKPSAPLRPQEIPVPDFDDLPLTRYLSAETTLPLLSSRGCYWGKCEFCHHGMVYGEKYAGYQVDTVIDTLRSLSDRYGVRHFSFNDEAVPPKLARLLGERTPARDTTGWHFTGLMKFEDFFQREDFANLHRMGFRSLYVGLESASERVLALMRKNTRREVMVRNLSDATLAGIWMHCFLFFGFPGETEAEAKETFDFVLENPEIIGSFGAGTFSLEHNAPIFRHLEDFGLSLKRAAGEDIDVYYDYEVAEGLTPERAADWAQELNDAAADIPGYYSAGWVPRELLLGLLSRMSPAELVERGTKLRRDSGFPAAVPLRHVVSRSPHPDRPDQSIVINRVNGNVLLVGGGARLLLDACLESDLDLGTLRTLAPVLLDRLCPPKPPAADADIDVNVREPVPVGAG